MFELLFWGAILIMAIAVELHTAALVSVWFAVGAVFAYISSFFFSEFTVQLGIFTAVSVISLILSFVLVKRRPFKKSDRPVTGGEFYIGKNAVVTEEINNVKGTGRVKLEDSFWLAISENKEDIPTDEIVTVKSIDGAKLIVTSVN